MTTKERSAAFPAIPTAHEQGLKDFVAENWLALFFPKGTPAAIVQRLNEAAIAAMNTPAVQDQLKKNGADIVAPERRYAGIPAKIRRERDREMGRADQGRRPERRVSERGGLRPDVR